MRIYSNSLRIIFFVFVVMTLCVFLWYMESSQQNIATKTMLIKQIDADIQVVADTPILAQIRGEIKKFNTDPRRDTHKVAPNANANSFPLK